MKDPRLSDWGLYVHIPFCRARCTYCDFNTVTNMDSMDHERYVRALMAEWETEELPEGSIVSIFFGGGTPSLVDPALFQELLGALARRIGANLHELEITLEANPGTVTLDRLKRYREIGINRLSIGAQALQNRHLADLNRAHDVREIFEAVTMARTAGFSNISLDAIYGLPGQTMDEWQETVEGLIQLDPDHLSLYQLQIEEGTPLATGIKQGTLFLPESDTTADMQDYAEERLRQANLLRYEISNFSRPGYHSRHNQLYWTLNPYLALGAGAHAYHGGRRWSNVRGVRRYMERALAGQDPKVAEEVLSRDEEMREFTWLGLRELQGFSDQRFEERFGAHPDTIFAERFDSLRQQGLVEKGGGRRYLTARGRDVANYVFRAFIDAPSP